MQWYIPVFFFPCQQRLLRSGWSRQIGKVFPPTIRWWPPDFTRFFRRFLENSDGSSLPILEGPVKTVRPLIFFLNFYNWLSLISVFEVLPYQHVCRARCLPGVVGTEGKLFPRRQPRLLGAVSPEGPVLRMSWPS